MIKLISPNGGAVVMAHPSRVKQMLDQGFTKADEAKKPTKKKESN